MACHLFYRKPSTSLLAVFSTFWAGPQGAESGVLDETQCERCQSVVLLVFSGFTISLEPYLCSFCTYLCQTHGTLHLPLPLPMPWRASSCFWAFGLQQWFSDFSVESFFKENLVRLCDTRFLSLSTSDIQGWIILCWGELVYDGGVFISVLGLYSVDTSSVPSCDNRNCLWTMPDVPRG